MNPKWKDSVMNSECYSSFASVDSDHRVVTAKVRLLLRANTPPLNKTQHDLNCLRYNQYIQADFSVKLHNKFEALFYKTATISEQYSAFVTANKIAAEETLPPVK